MQKHADKKVVVVGGTSGMGLATVKALLADGAEVLVTGRSEKNVQAARQALGPRAHVERCDLARRADIEALAHRVGETLAQVDLVFINAGVAELAPFEHVDPAMYDRMFDVNAKGAYFTVQRLAARVRDGGAIVLTTSVTNFTGSAGMSVYSGTKAALRAFARVFAAELLPRGIRVNTISPGFIKTESMGVAGLSAEERDAFEKLGDETTPMKRHGTVDEIARAVLFLAFEATFTTGAELPVTGGLGLGLSPPDKEAP